MIQSLIVFLNRRCPVGCATCNAGAPVAVGAAKEELSPQWLESFFQKLEQEPLDFPGYIIWTGGEPFLSFEALLRGVSLSSLSGYRSEILSSAIWFDQHPQYLEALTAFKKLSIRISLDAEHQETVPVSRVIALIRQADALGIQINFTLRNIPGRTDPMQTIEVIKRRLPEFYHRNRRNSRWIHSIPHMSIHEEKKGKEKKGTDIKNQYKQGTVKARKACNMAFRDLVIGADGLAYPCCGFFGLPFHQQMALGDPLTETWQSLAAKKSDVPFFSKLTQKGPYAMIKEKGLDPSQWNWPGYHIPCDYCLAYFTLPIRQGINYI